MTSLVRRSLTSTGRFETVRVRTGADADKWSLDLEVQQFYGILDAADLTSSVDVRFEGSLRCREQTHPLQLDASQPVHEVRLAAVVRAHQRALDDTIGVLLQN